MRVCVCVCGGGGGVMHVCVAVLHTHLIHECAVLAGVCGGHGWFNCHLRKGLRRPESEEEEFLNWQLMTSIVQTLYFISYQESIACVIFCMGTW